MAILKQYKVAREGRTVPAYHAHVIALPGTTYVGARELNIDPIAESVVIDEAIDSEN